MGLRTDSAISGQSSLFGRSRLLDWWLIGGGQVPVDRSSGAAGFQAATDVVNAGDLLVVYVEGAITKDPTGWPMRPKTGAARIALMTGAPVMPVGQWGAQELLPPYSRRLSLKRPHIHFSVGHEVNLVDLVSRAGDPDAVREATDRIMSAIVERVETLPRPEGPSRSLRPTHARPVRDRAAKQLPLSSLGSSILLGAGLAGVFVWTGVRQQF